MAAFEQVVRSQAEQMMKARRPDSIVNFGSNLKYLRQKKGKTRRELAYTLGIQESEITGYETGIMEPNHHKLIQMSKYFKINLNEFIEADLTAPLYTYREFDHETNPKYDFYHFLKCTSEAQSILDEILAKPAIEKVFETITEDQEVEMELIRCNYTTYSAALGKSTFSPFPP